jgi:hypothetical protein
MEFKNFENSKISKLQKCFTTYNWGIIYVMYWKKKNYITLNSILKITFFGVISNYHHFSR